MDYGCQLICTGANSLGRAQPAFHSSHIKPHWGLLLAVRLDTPSRNALARRWDFLLFGAEICVSR
jgi:hypothetical protein